MGRPTRTRAELRRAIGMELKMDFYRRYGTTLTVSDGTAASPADNTITSDTTDYWKNAWFYVASSTTDANEEERLVVNYVDTASVFTLDRALSTDMVAGDEYELLDVFNAREIHQAINRSVEEGFPEFYDITIDETLIIEEDKLEYDLTGLSSRPWLIMTVYVERNTTAMQGVVDSATSTTITDASGSFSDVGSGWRLSIYAGTGSGQLRVVDSVASQIITVTSAFTTTPDSTSKYNLWDPSVQEVDWYRMMAVRFDNKTYPEKMWFKDNYDTRLPGMRLRLQYYAKPSDLITDAAVTVVPREYIINKALGYLTGSRVNDNRSDRQRYQDLEERYHAKADIYKREEQWQPPDINLWMEEDPAGPGGNFVDDPMGWRVGHHRR